MKNWNGEWVKNLKKEKKKIAFFILPVGRVIHSSDASYYIWGGWGWGQAMRLHSAAADQTPHSRTGEDTGWRAYSIITIDGMKSKHWKTDGKVFLEF